MSWHDQRKLYIDYFIEQGFRPQIDGDGDVCFMYEGEVYYVVDGGPDNFLNLLRPNVYAVETEDELGRVKVAMNRATRLTPVAKLFLDDDLQTVSARAGAHLSVATEFGDLPLYLLLDTQGVVRKLYENL